MKIIKKLLVLALICVLIAVGLDLFVVLSTGDDIYEVQNLSQTKEYDAILILGCGIVDENTPTPMLEERLDTGLELYKKGVAPRILISGDNGQQGYNEIHVMLHYLLDKGVAEEDIFCDHAGFNTYDSVLRAQEIFDIESMAIVSQKYHLYRAIYIAQDQGMDAIGIEADRYEYSFAGNLYREVRELMARDKDLVKSMLNLDPTYGGEKISLDGDSKESWEESEK